MPAFSNVSTFESVFSSSSFGNASVFERFSLSFPFITFKKPFHNMTMRRYEFFLRVLMNPVSMTLFTCEFVNGAFTAHVEDIMF